MVTLLSRALATIRSSSPFPVRSAAARLVGRAVVAEGRCARADLDRLAADRVNRDGEDELIGRERGVEVGVGGRDGEPRPDPQDRDRARGAAGVEDHGRGEGAGRAGQSRAIEDVARLVQHDAVQDAIAVQVCQERRIAQPDAAAGRGRLEGAITLAQQHADRAIVVVDGDEVGPAVAVDVRHDAFGPATRRWRRSAGSTKEPSPLFNRTLTLLPP